MVTDFAETHLKSRSATYLRTSPAGGGGGGGVGGGGGERSPKSAQSLCNVREKSLCHWSDSGEDAASGLSVRGAAERRGTLWSAAAAMVEVVLVYWRKSGA